MAHLAGFVGKEVPSELEELVKPHVDSFNFFLGDGIRLAVADLDPYEMEHEGERIEFALDSVHMGFPSQPRNDAKELFPAEVPSNLCPSLNAQRRDRVKSPMPFLFGAVLSSRYSSLFLNSQGGRSHS